MINSWFGLVPFREKLLFIRGLYNEQALKGNIHSSQTGNLLSGAPLASGGEIRSGTSIDQLLAQLGQLLGDALLLRFQPGADPARESANLGLRRRAGRADRAGRALAGMRVTAMRSADSAKATAVAQNVAVEPTTPLRVSAGCSCRSPGSTPSRTSSRSASSPGARAPRPRTRSSTSRSRRRFP